MSKIHPSIPAIDGVQDKKVENILIPMKARLEMIAGETPKRPLIKKLGGDATLAGAINKINELISRLQE